MKHRVVIYKPITDEQIRIVAASYADVDIAGLRCALDEAAEQFILDHYDQQRFRPASLEKKLIRIESTAARLLSALKMDDDFDLESILNARLDWQLAPLIQQIDLLKTIASDASRRQGKQKTKSKSVHSEDAAFSALLEAMGSICMRYFQRLPGFTTNSGEADGMFAKFTASALQCIKDNLSDCVKTSDPSIVQSLDKSSDAIRSYWRRVKSSSISF